MRRGECSFFFYRVTVVRVCSCADFGTWVLWTNTKERLMSLHVVDHPLIAHKMGVLRRKKLPTKDFNDLVAEITALLLYEATRDLPTEACRITCWSGRTTVRRIKGRMLTFVPILRAGMGMLEGAKRLVPGAKISVVGLWRDHETLDPHEYYVKLASDMSDRLAIILDPMLATGGSALATFDLLERSGCRDIRGIFLVAAPEGIARLQAAHPGMKIFVAAVDKRLTGKGDPYPPGYILPGLGDAGDRLFGTK